MNNLDKYKLNQSILNQPDYVLELWYGKAGLFFISKLREINRIQGHEYPNYEVIINYFGDNNKWLLHYDTKTETFWINYIYIWSILFSEYQLNHQQIKELTKTILEQVTNCKVNTTYNSTSLEQVTNYRVITKMLHLK
jgi:hypothetical protein